MKCFHCDAAKVPCVYETPTVWTVMVCVGAEQKSRSFLSMGNAMEYVASLPEEVLLRIFEQDLFTGQVLELT